MVSPFKIELKEKQTKMADEARLAFRKKKLRIVEDVIFKSTKDL